MLTRIIVLIEDDWELFGNGLGNVADVQYLPLLFLLRLADQLGLKITFMAEVMQQLAMRGGRGVPDATPLPRRVCGTSAFE